MLQFTSLDVTDSTFMLSVDEPKIRILEKPERLIFRIEFESGYGPFNSYFEAGFQRFPKTLVDVLRTTDVPIDDFEILKYGLSYKGFCEQILGADEIDCVFGFPSYEMLRKYVGEFVKIYRSKRYLISRSGEQVLFVREEK